MVHQYTGADAGFLKGGGGPTWVYTQKGGPVLGPMLKSLHRGPKGGGGVQTPDPPPPHLILKKVYYVNSNYIEHGILDMGYYICKFEVMLYKYMSCLSVSLINKA